MVKKETAHVSTADQTLVLSSLEHDQTGRSQETPHSRRHFETPELIVLWALRLYLLFMMAVVGYQVLDGPLNQSLCDSHPVEKYWPVIAWLGPSASESARQQCRFPQPDTSVTSQPLPTAALPSYSDNESVARTQLRITHPRMDSLRIYSLVAAGTAVALGAYALFRRKPKDAADLERERRTWLDGIGRITDGTVIDVQELPAATAIIPPCSSSTSTMSRVFPTSARRRDLPAPVDQPALLPARLAHFSEI